MLTAPHVQMGPRQSGELRLCSRITKHSTIQLMQRTRERQLCSGDGAEGLQDGILGGLHSPPPSGPPPARGMERMAMLAGTMQGAGALPNALTKVVFE